MDTRRIEITEDDLKDGIETYYAGDIKSFPKAKADLFIRMGWARDVETGETGERKPGAVKIQPHDVVQESL